MLTWLSSVYYKWFQFSIWAGDIKFPSEINVMKQKKAPFKKQPYVNNNWVLG